MKVTIGPYPKNSDKKQKVDVRIDSYDLWNLDYTLSIVILASLRSFRKDAAGHPASISMKKWESILDHMILAFSKMVDGDFNLKKDPEIDRGLKLFAKYFQHLWF